MCMAPVSACACGVCVCVCVSVCGCAGCMVCGARRVLCGVWCVLRVVGWQRARGCMSVSTPCIELIKGSRGASAYMVMCMGKWG